MADQPQPFQPEPEPTFPTAPGGKPPRGRPPLVATGFADDDDGSPPWRSSGEGPAVRVNPASRWAAVVLGVGAFAIVLAAQPHKPFDLDRFFVPKELALHLTAALAGVPLLLRTRRLRLNRVDALLAALLLLSLASALFADNWWLAFRALAVTASGAAIYWSARAAASPLGVGGRRRRMLVLALAVATAVAAGTSLAQAYGVSTTYFSINRAPGGTLGNRNFVAHLAAIGLPSLVALGVLARRAAVVALVAVALAASTAALVLSRTRAAWLALIVGFVVFLATLLFRRRWSEARAGRMLTLRLFLPTMLGAAGALLLPNRLNWNSDAPYAETAANVVNFQEGSGRGRLIQWRNSAQIAFDDPLLGAGPGNWSVAYPRYASRRDPSMDRDDNVTQNPWPSSDWVAYLAERGPLGVLLLAGVMAGLFFAAVRQMRTARNAEDFVFGAALAVTAAVTSVVGAFDAVLLLPAPALLAWGLLGALGAGDPGREVTSLSSAGRRAALVAAGVLAIAAPLRSLAQSLAIATFSTSGRTVILERAALLDPGSYRIRSRLAEIYAQSGRCRSARGHARAAAEMLPEARPPKRILARCGAK
ncbi:MAG: O-antigen ligase family protein [Gemmatimonadaceae bacterium]